ncbi:MAG: endo-1,4-beta-xylanase [Chloroflexi bacterium]|nr:endo-1,4-beta-xylanase [Chloroflexota bacterium]
MKRLLLVFTLLILVLPMTDMTEAQDTAVSLREFAAQNNIYIGAAAWTQHLDVPEHSEILGREFNMLTPEHEAKFCMISSARGEYDFGRVDELVEFAEAHDMAIHGHTLIWHSCSPDWVENGNFTRDEAIEVLKEHITTVVSRYKGRIKYWDVVNEVFDGAELRDTVWLRTIGPEYIEMAYQFAHEADPDALLLYNDYGAEGINDKSDAIYAMAQDFVNRGIPLNGIGLQSHFDLGGINFASIAENVARIGELGLEVQFTEVDIKYLGDTDEDILRRQARDYYHLMEVCLDADNCTAFIVWGVSDQFTWLRSPDYFNNPTVQPLLFSDDYQAKPAYFALMDILMRRVGATSILSDDAIAAILNDPVAEVALPDATFTDPNQLAPDSVPGVAYYAPMGVTITLDGDLSDWGNVPRVTVDKGTLDGPGAESYEFAVAVDDTNLYFMANVTDPNVMFGEFGAGDWYQTDSVEFYINATGNLAAASYEPGVVQIGILAENATQPAAPLYGGGSSDTITVSIAAVETETGYIIEASVPLVSDIWNITPEHMGVLGFQTHLNGSSGSGRDAKFIWSAADTQDQSWTNPSLFGQLIFWDKNQ